MPNNFINDIDYLGKAEVEKITKHSFKFELWNSKLRVKIIF